MSIADYKRALTAAVREYEEATAQHAALETRLAQLKQSIATLTKLCGYEPTVQLGLTEACRMVLRNAVQPMSPRDVRDRLVAIGLDMGRYSNALASIHTVIKRLHESGEVAERKGVAGMDAKVAYLYGSDTLVAAVAKSRTASKRPIGEGLCPPKARRR